MKRDSNVLLHRLGLIRTGLTSLYFAILALEDIPMWPAIAYTANPLNERRIGFQVIESVAAACDCH